MTSNMINPLEALDNTVTPLGTNGTWTSLVDDAPDTGLITGTVFADQAGTLYVDQSPDNTNWDFSQSLSISASVGDGFTVQKVALYARVRYVNGGTAQTVFRLYANMRKRVL